MTENKKNSHEHTLRDIFVFIVVLFASNALWKFLIRGDDFHKEIMFCGMTDIQFLFQWAIDSTAWCATHILNLFGMDAILSKDNIIFYTNGQGCSIVWGCTAIKQSFIFTLIILFSRGRIKNKLVFIPIGWVVIYLLNIIRITIIAGAVKNNPESFEMLHGFLLKYMFYIIIFFIWVYWEEKFAKSRIETSPDETETTEQ